VGVLLTPEFCLLRPDIPVLGLGHK
jgi:hypothetical protein